MTNISMWKVNLTIYIYQTDGMGLNISLTQKQKSWIEPFLVACQDEQPSLLHYEV